ncbi:hypothetical protein C8F04DRAFT_1126183 [Mycena alexandri]|uniref:Uncharacterized protein n=1 Tax=Mycena alexandri TaxID=1745969 RepID=A0AAD6WYY8_9AGAR|nr:hypothetical protein C8F04DRAFT_1126183 [Mycena alexandri]
MQQFRVGPPRQVLRGSPHQVSASSAPVLMPAASILTLGDNNSSHRQELFAPDYFTDQHHAPCTRPTRLLSQIPNQAVIVTPNAPKKKPPESSCFEFCQRDQDYLALTVTGSASGKLLVCGVPVDPSILRTLIGVSPFYGLRASAHLCAVGNLNERRPIS